MSDFMIDGKQRSENRIAVLIDAENVPFRYVREMLAEIARYGTPTIKRIYADWTSPCVSGWKGVLLENAITPIQQYSYTQGKNSTDSAMIIDAMDILYAGNVDAFCIVSSDSDFTRLAVRLREAGKIVFGIGEKKTPEAFTTACDKFIYLEILMPEKDTQVNAQKQEKKKNDKKDGLSPCRCLIPKKELDLLISSVKDLADDDGWAFLGDVGNLLLKKQPSFDARNFGFDKLTDMFEYTGSFLVDRRQTANPAVKHIYIKVK